MASLQILRNGDPTHHTCGATLVSHRYAVTNAHCVTRFPDTTPLPAGVFHLRIGSTDRTNGGVLVGVEKILPHADWTWGAGPALVADIALLRLDTYVQLQPIQVAAKLTHGPVKLLGWGVTEPDGEGPLPQFLQELDTKLVPAAQCTDQTGDTAGIGEICLANPNGTDGACFGDSGSPALQRIPGTNRWAGIGGTSRGPVPCGIAPAVYTDWSYFRGWMYQVMRTGQVPPRTNGGQLRPGPVTKVMAAFHAQALAADPSIANFCRWDPVWGCQHNK
jgi:secreted trypsin-like serine protease